MERFYWLLLGVLCAWRVTHLLQAEDGPWDLVVRLRRRAGSGQWGRLLDCFYCLSAWVAVPLAWALGATWGERLLLWPALSAGAILLERVTAPRERVPAAAYYEEPEDDDAVLRTEEDRGGKPGRDA